MLGMDALGLQTGRGAVVSQAKRCNSISFSEICVKTVPFVFCKTFQPQNDRGSTNPHTKKYIFFCGYSATRQNSVFIIQRYELTESNK